MQGSSSSLSEVKSSSRGHEGKTEAESVHQTSQVDFPQETTLAIQFKRSSAEDLKNDPLAPTGEH